MTIPEQPEHPTFEQLLAINAELREMVGALLQRVTELEGEIERLRKQGPKPPALSDLPHFVKPNKPKKEPKDNKGRRQRDRGYARPLSSTPTRIETHAVDQCPDCGRNLQGGTVHSQREVIDIPPVVVEVVRHQFLARWCGVCKKRQLPRSSDVLSSVVLGQHRFGVRLTSLVAHLVNVCRVPVRTVKKLLASLFGVDISGGGIIALLKSIAQAGAKTYEDLRDQVRSSPFVHADETGFRQDGVNGYLWSFSTPGPSGVRYFVRDPSRGHQVPEAVLGSDYGGIIVSDFYGGYNYHLGPHQRCWVHLLRDVKKLQEAYPDDDSLKQWAQRVHGLYAEATSCCWIRNKDRLRARERFQRRMVALARPYLKTARPQAVLANRLIQFEPELFTFVEHPEVPPDNNAAERAIRPAVVARKVSGGTRSKVGSDTRAVLMSLFGTWQARNLDPLEACVRMLSSTARSISLSP